MLLERVGQRSDGVSDSRQRVGGGYESRLKHSDSLVEESPVDSNEYLAAAHGVVWGNECVVVTREKEHIVVCQEDMGFQ